MLLCFASFQWLHGSNLSSTQLTLNLWISSNHCQYLQLFLDIHIWMCFDSWGHNDPNWSHPFPSSSCSVSGVLMIWFKTQWSSFTPSLVPYLSVNFSVLFFLTHNVWCSFSSSLCQLLICFLSSDSRKNSRIKDTVPHMQSWEKHTSLCCDVMSFLILIISLTTYMLFHWALWKHRSTSFLSQTYVFPL